MPAKKGGLGKGLGKGLDLLISNQYVEEKQEEKPAVAPIEEEKPDQFVKIRLIEPTKGQPRNTFDEDRLGELAESIKKYGVLQPIVVKQNGEHYQIIAGERRWRAARMAGLKEVPVIIRDCNEQEQAEMSLIENLQREDLNPIEEALAYQALIQAYQLKQDEIAERVFKSRTVITNALRLLKLDPKVQNMLIEGVISTGHAKVLLGLDNGEDQVLVAERIVDEELSVRETEKVIKSIQSAKVRPVKPELSNKQLYETIEEKMKARVETMVKIKRKGENAGKIEIEYYNAEDLERIMERMGINA